MGVSGLSVAHQATATVHLQQCRDVLRRLREGIDLLCSNADVRLAFCFANKAMALQSRWTRQRVDPWRPFQLVFQLINIPALAQPVSTDRLACDLLWIPTGGGKTEAYLGLAAFTFGFRRLDARLQNRTEGGGGVSVLSRYTLRLLTIQQFRRALALVTACEALRVHSTGTARGWRPKDADQEPGWIWGRTRFSIGLWVGGNVTPNGLFTFSFPGPTGALQTAWGVSSIQKGTTTARVKANRRMLSSLPRPVRFLQFLQADSLPVERRRFTWSCRARISRGFLIQTLCRAQCNSGQVDRCRSHSSAWSPRRLRLTVISRTTTP